MVQLKEQCNLGQSGQSYGVIAALTSNFLNEQIVNGLELPAESSNSRRLANCLLERLEIFSFPGAAVSRECPSSRLIFRALRKITSVLVSTLFASMVIKQTVIQ